MVLFQQIESEKRYGYNCVSSEKQGYNSGSVNR